MSASEIIAHGDKLFSQRSPALQHWQEIAEHFYYDRATFTSAVNLGTDYAAHSMSSVAALARREMGNMYRTMLRPKEFFALGVEGEDFRGEERAWLEWAAGEMRTDMYRKGANFNRSTSVTDHDHTAFGQGVLEVCHTPDRDNLFFKNYHLKDVVWSDDYADNVETIHRNAMPTVDTLKKKFPNTCPKDIETMHRENPYKRVKARHVVAPVGVYNIKASGRHEFISVWVLPEFDTILEAVTRPFKGYVIPRAELLEGTQYAKSPFTSIILPDARTKQAIERILLEAGEKAVDPPMVAVKEAMRGDIGLYAGGVTWVDEAYDERLGASIRPVDQNRSGLPFGLDMSAQYDRVITDGMMLNKINLPEVSGNRTAYETRKLVEQHIRANVPMWEPVEVEYSEPLCDEIFSVMRFLGRFPVDEMPEGLRGIETEWQFSNPVKDMEKENKPQQMQEGIAILAQAAQLKPEIVKKANIDEMVEDALRAIGWSEDWFASEEDYEAAVEEMREQMAAQAEAAQVEQAVDVAGKAAPLIEGEQAA